MPLLGLRPVDPEQEFRRRSTLDLTNLFRHNGQQRQASSSTTNLQTESNRKPKTTGTAPNSDSGDEKTEENDNTVDNEPESPGSPPIQRLTSNHNRFSKLKFRHASDSQLSIKAKRQAEHTPPVPAVSAQTPKIITTAPTMDDVSSAQVSVSKKKLSLTPFRTRASVELPQKDGPPHKSPNKRSSTEPNRLRFGSMRGLRSTHSIAEDITPIPADGNTSALEAPSVSRMSSSQSTNSTKQSILPTRKDSSTIPRFKLPGRKKYEKPLFPLPNKISKDQASDEPTTPKRSRISRIATNNQRPLSMYSPPLTAIHKPLTALNQTNGSASSLPATVLKSAAPAAPASSSSLQASSISFAPADASILRNNSMISARSTSSSPARRSGSRAGLRHRSSTMASISGRSGKSDEVPPTPSLPGSCRTSTSTTGRSSFSNVFSKFRQNSGSQSPRYGSPAHNHTGTTAFSSKQNSFSISREVLHVPPREKGETPSKYLARIEEHIPRSMIASAMSKSGDQFSLAVLRSHMRSFSFFGDPMDMALRKLLMEATLPKETQQIDRVIQGFADRYHECNPGIFASAEEAYFIAFSLIILHTDVFNKNNKHKMQKGDYLKNSSTEGVSEDVLGCFYDNIVYTPFIHVDEDPSMSASFSRKGTNPVLKAAVAIADPTKKNSKEPLDPYSLILDSKLDTLRPNLKHVMNLEDPYNYLGTAQAFNVRNLQRSFFRCGVLQIVSARSRPDAFMSPSTIDNPQEAQAGVVEIKVTKVGILWRKDTKKRAARSPWQEWGAILTGTQLYLFKNSNWVKQLIYQCEQHQKQGHGSSPVIFKPPLQEFKPDAFLSTENAVALIDSNYKRHKNALVFVRHGGLEEILLADNEQELNSWIAMLNYAAAFTTAGVRIRGLVGGNYEGQRNRGIRQLGSSNAVHTTQTATGEVSIQSGRIDRELAQEILAARRDMMQQKIEESEDRISELIKELDSQLRDARHLQILAPLQPRTREQLVHAAGRMSAKLKWARLEIWKMKCHRDILVLDLEEEKKNTSETQAKIEQIASSNALVIANQSEKLQNEAAPKDQPENPQVTPTIPQMSPRTSFQSSVRIFEEPSPLDEIFSTPCVSRNASPSRPTVSTDPTPQDYPLYTRRGSAVSVAKSSSAQGSLGHRSSKSSIFDQQNEQQSTSPVISEAASKLATSSPDGKEAELLRKAGLLDSDGRPRTADGSSDWYSGSPEQRTKVKHNLHRTLRDGRDSTKSTGQLHTSGRSRKTRDSVSSGMSEYNGIGAVDGIVSQAASTNGSPVIGSHGTAPSPLTAATSKRPEILPRSRGSFTVHGKKASLVNFGADWQKGPAEQRLRARKMSGATETKAPGVELSSAAGVSSSDSNGDGIGSVVVNGSSFSPPNESQGGHVIVDHLKPRPALVASGPSGRGGGGGGGDLSARSSLMDVHEVDAEDSFHDTEGSKNVDMNTTAQRTSAFRNSSGAVEHEDTASEVSSYEETRDGDSGSERERPQLVSAKSGTV